MPGPWHRGGMAHEVPGVLGPLPPRCGRRRVLLQLALIAEAGAALFLLRLPVVTARPAASSQSSFTEMTTGAPTLVLGDGRTVHLLGLGGATTSDLLIRVGREIAGAVDAVVAFWGADWQRDIVIVAAGSHEQFHQLTRGPAGTQWVDIAAAAVADSVDPVHHVATGQRIVFAPGAFAMSDYALRIVLRHELFHFASRAYTALDSPRWLTEGVADFVGRPATPRPGPVAAAALAKLPVDSDFDSSGALQTLAYDRAWWFARFIADTYGIATLRTLYLHVGGNGHPDAATATVDLLHGDEAELLARMKHWLAG
jgi:hypothetical protein